MDNDQRPAPNTYLGEVSFYIAPIFGTLEWILQGLLGMSAKPTDPHDDGYLDVKKHTAEELW